MKKYFLHNGTEQEGPYLLDELKQKNISKDISVWTEGMAHWEKAGNVEELKMLFINVPPPFPPRPINEKSNNRSPKDQKKPKGILVLGIIGITILIIGGISIWRGYLNSENNEGLASLPTIEIPREKTPEELRQELLEKEQTSPSTYLSTNGTWRRNLLGVMVLEGTISNNATMAGFKDILLEVTWLSKTNSEISTSHYRVYEYVKAGGTANFKLKVDAPRATADVRIGVNSAVATQR